MRQNPGRRAALLDGSIELLAREGARGLTLRAVDKEAAVPIGTASNYFRNRDDLLIQTCARVYERLRPDEASLTRMLDRARDSTSYAAMLRKTVDRIAAFRTGHLALLELRLEATRRPELQELLTAQVRADIDENIARHEAAGLPGGAHAVLLMHAAMNWLIVERLTLPEVLTQREREELVTQAVERILGPFPAATTRHPASTPRHH